VILLGEASVSKDLLNYEEVARNVILDVGYDAEEKGLDGRTCEMKQIIVQ
jgi:S-adenosylmethionine synthetase